MCVPALTHFWESYLGADAEELAWQRTIRVAQHPLPPRARCTRSLGPRLRLGFDAAAAADRLRLLRIRVTPGGACGGRHMLAAAHAPLGLGDGSAHAWLPRLARARFAARF